MSKKSPEVTDRKGGKKDGYVYKGVIGVSFVDRDKQNEGITG